MLLEQDAAAVPAALSRLLRRSGLLMLLTGNAREPYCGPNVLSEGQLCAAFGGGGGGGGSGEATDGQQQKQDGEGEAAGGEVQRRQWEFVFLTQSRFDWTRHYREALGKRPLAWWALLRLL